MTPIANNITVDLNGITVKANVLPKQWEDNARTVEIKFTKDGEDFDLSEYFATFVAKKSDNTYADGECDIDSNSVYLVFTEQMCSFPGSLEVVISLIKPGISIKSPLIQFQIEKGLNPDSIISDNQKTLANELLGLKGKVFTGAQRINNYIYFYNDAEKTVSKVDLPEQESSGGDIPDDVSEVIGYINKYKRANIHKIFSTAAAYFAQGDNGQIVFRYSAGTYNYETIKSVGQIAIQAGDIPYNNARWLTLDLENQTFGYEDDISYVEESEDIYIIGYMYDRYGVETVILYDNGTVSNEPTTRELQDHIADITSRVEKIEEVLVSAGLATINTQ